MKVLRKCNYCNKEYYADTRDLNRGWGLCCSKSCAAHLREKSKPNYNKHRVVRNNYRRLHWNDYYIDYYEEERTLDALEGCQWTDLDIGTHD